MCNKKNHNNLVNDDKKKQVLSLAPSCNPEKPQRQQIPAQISCPCLIRQRSHCTRQPLSLVLLSKISISDKMLHEKLGQNIKFLKAIPRPAPDPHQETNTTVNRMATLNNGILIRTETNMCYKRSNFWR